jgi:hypothetical protein
MAIRKSGNKFKKKFWLLNLSRRLQRRILPLKAFAWEIEEPAPVERHFLVDIVVITLLMSKEYLKRKLKSENIYYKKK